MDGDRRLSLVPTSSATKIVASAKAPVAKKGAIPERDPGLPQALTIEEAHALIMAAGSDRDRLLLETIYRTGARASEAAQLRYCDLEEDAIRLPNRKQRRKDRAEKLVYVGQDLVVRLMFWAQRRHLALDGLLFPSRKGGGALNKDQVRRIVMAAGGRAGILLEKHGQRRAPWTHVLRHSAAVRWLDGSGGNIEFAAEQMGHSSLKSMESYRAIADARRRAIARQCEF